MATRASWTPGPLVVAAALPLLFLHRHYQPELAISAGSTTLNADLSDLAALAVGVAGIAAGLRHGFERLRPAWAPAAASAALLVWILVSVGYGASREGWYPTGTHLVTALKFAEYALLALGLPLLLRRAADLVPPALALVAWSAVATIVGLLQFAGALGDLDNTPAGRRKPSFLGYHDFAALSAAALAVAAVLFAFGNLSPRARRVIVVAALSGGLGVILAGPVDALLGTLLALAALLALARARLGLTPRRAAGLCGAWLVLLGGVLAIRSSAIDEGLRFLGIRPKQTASTTQVQSYSQRALLAYIGGRIWLDHPLLGVGWQGSADEPAYASYLADARRRFDQPPQAFPSPRHPWGVQNAYVQALADMGVIGLVLFLAPFVTGVIVAGRSFLAAAAPAALVAVLWLLVCAGIWNGFGLTAGIPIDALTWLALGLVATAAALARRPA